MTVKELRNKLENWDGDMEVIVLDEERNQYDFAGISLVPTGRYSEPKLAIKFE